MIQKHDVIDFVDRNGLRNSVICLHSSFKSLGPVLGGPAALIDAFLESDCTLLVPTFYYDSETFPEAANYRNNGIDYDLVGQLESTSYEDRPDQIDKSMGAIPRVLVSDSRSVRTKNPHDSFCSVGKLAKVLFDDENLLNVYSPYKKILDESLLSFIVLVGVDFTSCTPIHFAEEKAGRTLFRRWAVYHGEVVEVEIGSCSDGFEKLRAHTRELEKVDNLGDSQVRIYPFEKFIDTVSSALSISPSMTICENASCVRCKDMSNGGRSASV